MFKILLKKELSQYFNMVSTRRKKRKSSRSKIAMFILFTFLYLLMCFAFFGLAVLSHETLNKVNLIWAYYSINGIMALFVGTFISIFNTYSGLFKARDNEMLMVLPIKPVVILMSRMVSIYILGTVFASMVWLPTVVVRIIFGSTSVLEVLFSLLMLLVIGFVVTALSCFLGFIVALISSKITHKNIVITILYVILFGFIYFLNFTLQSMLRKILAKPNVLASNLKNYAYPFYIFGNGCSGNVLMFLITLIVSGLIFALCLWIINLKFIKIITTSKQAKKKQYKESKTKTRPVIVALVLREMRKFLSIPTYLINGGMGVILLVIGSVLALFYQTRIEQFMITIQAIGINKYCFPILITGIINMLTSMDIISAPSVSLEAKTLWISKSLPIETKKILKSKIYNQFIINLIGIVVSLICLSIVTKPALIDILLMILITLIMDYAYAEFGLFIDLLKPNMDWTNEVTPIKQSLSVVIVVMLAMILNIGYVIAYYFLKDLISPRVYMLILIATLSICMVILKLWIENKGTKIYNNL